MATYRVEIREADGTLLGFLKDPISAILEEAVNAPKILSVTLPATDFRLPLILKKNELWVRNIDTDTVVAKTLLIRREDRRGA